MSQTTNDPSQIERDLDRTRSRLGSHLNELQDRLSPGQVLDDLMAYFRGSEGAAFGRNLVDSVRANPMPAAITGIGLAWLMASSPRGGTAAAATARFAHYGRDDHAATITRVEDAEREVTRLASETDDDYTARLDTARGQALGLTRHAQETASSFGQRVRDALGAARDAVSGTAHDAGRGVAGAAGAAGDALGSLAASAQDTLRGVGGYAGGALLQGGQAGANLAAAVAESPVMLGALGLAAGALLGALLPRSEQEEQALGGIAGQVRDTASDLARQAMEGGRHVAQAVADKAHESAGSSGFTDARTPGQLVDAALSGELAGSAKEVVHDALRTGEKAVAREVSSASPAPTTTAERPT